MSASRTKALRNTAVLFATAAGLVACGGDSDSPAPAPPPAPTAAVPASAGQSVAGFVAYLEALDASPADTLEPVDVSTFVAPTDDTAEPSAI